MSPLDRALAAVPIIAIVRGSPTVHVAAIASAAASAGITALEITLDSPDPFEAIAAVVGAGTGLCLGAGTVHTVDQVDAAADAGAAFIVSPHLDPGVVEAARRRGLASVPGAATPTEVAAARSAGADLVKWFPAQQLGGPAAVAAITGPLLSPPLVPTGGVGIDNGAAYLEAGAVALGVGSSVFPADALADGDADRVESLCRRLVAEVR